MVNLEVTGSDNNPLLKKYVDITWGTFNDKWFCHDRQILMNMFQDWVTV